MGATWHADVPWKILKKIYYSFRNKYFSANPPSRGYTHVAATEDELLEKLGSIHYAPDGSWMSYDKGEEINLAKVESVKWDNVPSAVRKELESYPSVAGEEEPITWWQTHLRAWKTEDGFKINGHWELEPFSHSSAHIDEIGYSDRRGLRNIVSDLESLSIQITEYPDIEL